MINQLSLKIAKSILSFKGGYYRGVNKKVDVPYNNNEPIWITMQKQLAQIYSENGTLFELDIDQNRLNIADVHDIQKLIDEGKIDDIDMIDCDEDTINDIIMNCDEQLIESLKQNGYNGMWWDDNGEFLTCIFDKGLIKDYWKLD